MDHPLIRDGHNINLGGDFARQRPAFPIPPTRKPPASAFSSRVISASVFLMDFRINAESSGFTNRASRTSTLMFSSRSFFATLSASIHQRSDSSHCHILAFNKTFTGSPDQGRWFAYRREHHCRIHEDNGSQPAGRIRLLTELLCAIRSHPGAQ